MTGNVLLPEIQEQHETHLVNNPIFLRFPGRGALEKLHFKHTVCSQTKGNTEYLILSKAQGNLRSAQLTDQTASHTEPALSSFGLWWNPLLAAQKGPKRQTACQGCAALPHFGPWVILVLICAQVGWVPFTSLPGQHKGALVQVSTSAPDLFFLMNC